MRLQIRQNLLLYLFFTSIAVIGIFYGRAIISDYSFLRVWEFTGIAVMLIGIPFLFLQQQAGIPDFLSASVKPKNRFLLPASIGIVFGLLDVLVFKFILHPHPYTELPPFLQPFPYSLFLYFSGAFEIEVFYRFIPLTLILLLGHWFKQGRYATIFFWTGAVLTALREPLEQLPEGMPWLIVYSLGTGLLMNFLQGIFFMHAGFLATFSLRLGHYLIWHILLGIYVQYIELA